MEFASPSDQKTPLPRVGLTTLGCKANQFDTAVLAERFVKEGFSIVPFEDEAEVYVVNTCTVTANADQDARRLLRGATRRNEGALKIVTGCYAQVAPEALAAIDGVHFVVGNSHKDRLVELAKSRSSVAGKPEICVDDMLRNKAISSFGVQLLGLRSRAFLKIQDGCSQFCSYCVIPFARGRNRSFSPDLILEELFRLRDAGIREAILTGIHIGTYGMDLPQKTSLLHLLERISRERPIERVRLSSIDPEELSEALIDRLLGDSIFCPHLHIPVQSGNDAVLERMRRRYTRAEFLDLVRRLKDKSPELAIGTDLIVGFPGEDDQAFSDSASLLKDSPIDYVHVFSYSPRTGTKAFEWGDSVSAAEKKARSHALQALGREKKRAFYKKFLGRAVDVVWEERRRREGFVKGVSGEYIPLYVKWEKSGELPAGHSVWLQNLDDSDRVWGELCEG